MPGCKPVLGSFPNAKEFFNLMARQLCTQIEYEKVAIGSGRLVAKDQMLDHLPRVMMI
jgi:hypothetical protein